MPTSSNHEVGFRCWCDSQRVEFYTLYWQRFKHGAFELNKAILGWICVRVVEQVGMRLFNDLSLTLTDMLVLIRFHIQYSS